jgi:hypothetical protein
MKSRVIVLSSTNLLTAGSILLERDGVVETPSTTDPDFAHSTGLAM